MTAAWPYEEDTSPNARARKLYGQHGVRAKGQSYDVEEAEGMLGRALCRMDPKAHAAVRAFAAMDLLTVVASLLKQRNYKHQLRNDGWILEIKQGRAEVCIGLTDDILSLWIGTFETRRSLPIEFDPMLWLFVGTEADRDCRFDAETGRYPRRSAVAVVAEEIIFALDPASKDAGIDRRRYPL